jgi:hypothetical protein
MIVGIVTQVAVANAVRTSVLKRTFRPIWVLVREWYKPIAGNLGFLNHESDGDSLVENTERIKKLSHKAYRVFEY